jgi:hypothetical protein
MSRTLTLVTLLAVPALASAQQAVPQGQVTFLNGRDFPMYVNASECGSGATVTIQWNVTLLGGVTSIPTGTTYQLYSSDVDPSTNTGGNTCFKTPATGTMTVNAGQITDQQGNNPIITQTAVINLTDFITKAAKSCADNGTTVWICVEATAGGTKVGFAEMAVTISTTQPPPPTITSITAGDQALNVSWDAGSVTSTFSGDTYAYRLTATAIQGTDTGSPRTSSRYTATSARFAGLVNDVVYSVTAEALSKADNASDPSNAVTGMPQHVLDFWDVYKNAGGRDDGGCAGGPAGPLALALVAVMLALGRRFR